MGLSDYKLKFVIDADGRTARQELNSLYGDINKLGGKFTSTFGGAIPLAGAAASAIAGIAVAAGAVGIALFNLAKNASEYGSAIFDAQEKTGLSAATLSTLKLAADSAGSSFEQVGTSIAKFAKLLGQARDGDEQAQATLKSLGVTTLDLDQALNQVTQTIFKAKSGTDQIVLSQKAFGKSGADLIPVIKQINGDLDASTKAAIKMGTALSEDDVRAADELGDALGVLSEQVKVGASKFALSYAPQITDAIKDISDHLAENQDDWKRWGSGVGDAANGVYKILNNLRQWAQDNPIIIKTLVMSNPLSAAGYLGAGELLNYGAGGDLLRQAPTNRPDVANDPRNPFYKPPAPPPGKGTGSSTEDDLEAAADAKKAADDRARERDAARKRELAAQLDHIRELLKIDRDYFETDQKSFEEAFLKKEITAEQWRETSEKNFEIYSAKAKKRLLDQFKIDAQGKTPLEIETLRLRKGSANTAVDNEVVREREDREKTITGVLTKADDERLTNAKQASEDLIALTRAENETLLARLEERLQNGLLKETTYAKAVGIIHLATLEKERAAETDLNRQKILDEAIKTQKIRNAMMVKTAVDKETEAIEKQTKAIEDQTKAVKSAAQAAVALARDKAVQTAKDAAQDKLNRTVGSSSAISSMDQLREHFVGTQNTAAIAGIDAMAWAFDGLGQALGQVVNAWVLYGNAGQSVRQMTAQILAGVAQQATVKAVFELAEGFAALAMSFFGVPNAGPSATAHFTAAAIYGSIAGIAAVAGRGVAGNSFNQSQGSAGGSSSSSSGGRNNENQSPYSRASENAYISGRRNDTAQLADEVRQLHQKIGSMSSGDILVAGARQKRGFIGNQVVSDIKSNAGIGRQMLAASGVK